MCYDYYVCDTVFVILVTEPAMWNRRQGVSKVLCVLGVQDKGVIVFERRLIPAARRGVLYLVGPEGGWYKLKNKVPNSSMDIGLVLRTIGIVFEP